MAGSGKTTVALYRAKHLLETQSTLFQEAHIVIFTFNKALAGYIKAVSPMINGGYNRDSDRITPRSRDGLNVQIINFHSWAFRFLGLPFGETIFEREKADIINRIKSSIPSSSSKILSKRDQFYIEEISWIKGKLFRTKQEYIDARRAGRGRIDRVSTNDKIVIWDIYQEYQEELHNRNKYDFDDYAVMALNKIESTPNWNPPYTHIIVDEAQDLNKAQILTIAKLVSPETNSISIIADAAQRIYKSGFTWTEVGLNVRGGRTIEFKKNYRNTAAIAKAATSLLDKDNDKSEFTVSEAGSIFGNKPKLVKCHDFCQELNYLVEQLNKYDSTTSKSTVVLHRTNVGVRMIESHLRSSGIECEQIKAGKPVNYYNSKVKICTMSSIKGLEFDRVFILQLNEDIIPFPPGFNDDDDEFHISTERRLLYTSMTRAKENMYLLCEASNPTRYLDEIESEFVENITLATSQTVNSPYNTSHTFTSSLKEIPRSEIQYEDDLPF